MKVSLSGFCLWVFMTMANAQSIIDIDHYDSAGEFNFIRIQYNSAYAGGYFGRGPWSIDFPDADVNFLRGVSRLTNIRVMSSPKVMRFDDKRIFDYPFLYALETGQAGGWELSLAEL